MTTIPLSLGELILLIFVMLPCLCAAATLAADHYYTRHHRKAQFAAVMEIAAQNRLLNDRRAVQLNIDNELRVREEAVAELGRRTKQTAETLRAEETHFDTMISLKDWDDLPHPGEDDDTRELPRIED